MEETHACPTEVSVMIEYGPYTSICCTFPSPFKTLLCAPLGLTHSNTTQEEGQGFLGTGSWSVEGPTALEVTHGGSGHGCWKARLSSTGWFWYFDNNLWIPSREKGHLV